MIGVTKPSDPTAATWTVSPSALGIRSDTRPASGKYADLAGAPSRHRTAPLVRRIRTACGLRADQSSGVSVASAWLREAGMASRPDGLRRTRQTAPPAAQRLAKPYEPAPVRVDRTAALVGQADA